ncbi:MAG: rhomboid family intramembrane serine protease [Flavobacteriaceae bacterium]|nr:rhomboid family intramembrane serine protease [Bacteroidia bacterium]MBT8287006.1 rhomboid family intramembrane serine protease [Bacteroidia bacterium]NNF75813.1 rhomboid family intramembrane serine protease [Flavobacteriaceae bacterium]NNK71652.1 rhomboid family intramembrane serine protease [Flavobacteriaceae bacterium]
MIRLTDTVKHLLIINALMFVGTLAFGNGQLFFQYFALYFPKNDLFQPWQILTHMFMHGGFMHIFFNMFALWMFGTAVEQVFGSKKFILFYILAGLGAAILQIAFMYFQFNSNLGDLVAEGYRADEVISILKQGRYNTGWQAVLGDDKLAQFVQSFNTTMVGASGAIMGVLVAFGMLFPNSKLMLIFLPIPIKAKYFIPAIILLDLISALTGQSFFSPSNTAYVAHVGGALTGFLMMYFWKKDQFDKFRWN